jgi:ATP-binding cassette subfamily B multidrug efflux pump
MERSYGFFEEDKLGDLKDLQLWRRILVYAWPQKKGILLAIFLSLTVIGTGLALPHLTRIAIDRFIIGHGLGRAVRLAGLKQMTSIFLLMVVLGFVANFFQVTVLEWSAQNIMHRLRQHLFSHLMGQDLAFFNTTPTGKLVTRLSNDIQNMNEMFTSVIVTLFNDGVQFVAILVILCTMNWRLGLLMLALVPLIILNLVVFSRLARDAFRAIRTRLAVINSFLQESLAGISLIQHFLREEDAEQKFRQENQAYTRENLRQIRLFALFVPFIEVLSAVAIALIIWYGGGEVLRQRMTFGELAAFISYMRLFFRPIREISEKFSIVQSAMASAERIFELLDREPAIHGGSQGNGRLKGEVAFSDIHFSYNPTEPILTGLNLAIRAGETIAIVGATGSGKSTIINLLERLYDPESGRITLDGRDLKEFDLDWLRKEIGLVIQDVLLIPGTLRDNICFGEEVSDDLLAEVLAKAQLTEVARLLPEGIETVIGEGAYELSTGQKQLLALARVLIRDPRILILDEATANIDSMTEMLVERAMRATISNRTSILIAHRLSTIRDAERIIVLDHGRIAEEGSYQELLTRDGLFHTLVEQQRLKAGA